MNKKILCFVMAVTVVASSTVSFSAYAKNDESKDNTPETTTAVTVVTTSPDSNKQDSDKITKEEAQEMLDKQQNELEENLALAEQKLAELEKSSKVTVEYIDTLDQKIGYINEQLTILEEQNFSIQEDIDKLIPSIEKNQKVLDELSKEVETTRKELDKLQTKFESVYEAYCYRLKVMYVSGDFNILTALLTCKDISSFLTRYEMIRSVSKSDTELLKEVQEQTEIIVTKQDGLDERVAKYETAKKQLDEQKATLDEKQDKIEENSAVIAQKKAILATDRAESDSLLAQLTAQNKQYTEFRNVDKELLEAVENEIQQLIAGIKSPDEITTAVAGDIDDYVSVPEINESDVYSKSDAVLNMVYPVPKHTSISAGYPNYSSGKYHGGIDFPCPTGTNVVAAQKGIVIAVKNREKSYGKYVMIYHGTDKKGRSVVTLYAHNSNILVSAGDSVKKGQVIAKSGSTGNSTGPHCHFEIRFDGVRSNPKNYLS